MKLGRYTEAIRYLRKGVQLRPKDAWMHLFLGTGFWHSGRNAEAAAAYEETLELDPTIAVAHTYLAKVLENLGDIDGAAEHYRRGKELQPLELDGFHLRSDFLRARGRVDEALAELEDGIRTDATFSWVRANKGSILEAQGKLEEAMNEYRAATALFPAGSGHLGIAGLLAARGQFDEALEEIVKAIQVRPGRRGSDGHVGAQRLLTKKDVPLAAAGLERLVAVLEAALPAEGDYPQLLRTLALARMRLGGKEAEGKATEPIRAALG